MNNQTILDLKQMPASGTEFLFHLRSQFFLPINQNVLKGEFPKFLVAPYATAGNNPPNLINIWCFENETKNAYIVGGVKGPTENPFGDFKIFEQHLETIKMGDQYQRLLQIIETALSNFIADNPALFR